MPERLIMSKVSKCMERVNRSYESKWRKPRAEYLQDILKDFAYEIMELCGKPVDDPPKSKFMEEWEEFKDKRGILLTLTEAFNKIIELIDKHKEDKRQS